MGLWQRLFGRKPDIVQQEDDWDEIIYSRVGVDFHAKEERKKYIDDCLEQMAEAKKEVELLSGEYSLVTAYLTDTEEIEALPAGEKENLSIAAKRLQSIEKERQGYLNKKNKMPDTIYYHLKEREDEIEDGIRKMKEAEEYGAVIKQDLQRLGREKHAYAYRKEELQGMLANQRGMAVIFLGALVVCLIILVILQVTLEIDAVIGYFTAILVTAVAVTVLCIKYMDAGRELGRVERAANRLIQLQNKVKIRYVNNTNLLNYLHIKYEVQNVKTLEKRYAQYLEEKELRNQYAEAEAKREYYQKQLIETLSRYRVRYPQRFTARVDALINRNELVEMRHEMIVRRQTLRKQMDYNNEVADNARNEIMDIARTYPEYAEEIAARVTKFERRGRNGQE